MQTWTVDEMLAHGPCEEYLDGRLEHLWDGRERLSVLDILELPIPKSDRVWASLQAGEHVRPVVERIVRRAVEAHAAHCGVVEIEAWAAKWLSGEDRSAESARVARAVAAHQDPGGRVVGAAYLAAYAAEGLNWTVAWVAVMRCSDRYAQQIDDIRAVVAGEPQ